MDDNWINEQVAFCKRLDAVEADAQRYQALRARIGDTAIEKLMSGEAAVYRVYECEECGQCLGKCLYDPHPAEEPIA